MDSIRIVDGTLREGEQTPGVFFTREEKLKIAVELDRSGVPVLDVGMPSVSRDERESIDAIVRQNLAASIGVSVRMISKEIDQAVECKVDEIFLICPVSRLHQRYKLGMDESQIKETAKGMIQYAVQRGLFVNLVAEDASRAEIPFLLDMADLAYGWGARRLFLCDTVGVMEPFKMKELVARVRDTAPVEMEIGVHCHDDLGLATANTMAAVRAGALYPSVTVNGIGERTGNAPLHEVAVGIEKSLKRNSGIDLKQLIGLSRLVEECSGIFVSPHAPIVGYNAFRHESGIHVNGILKYQETYTGVDPKIVDKDHSIVMGKHTGTQAVRHLLKNKGYTATDAELERILEMIKTQRVSQSKDVVYKMVNHVRKFYEQNFNFPQEDFWEIAAKVLKDNG